MRHKLKTIVTLVMAAAMAVSVVPVGTTAGAAGYTAPCTTVRVGLFTSAGDGYPDQKSFPSANLMNATDAGYGYELGWFDANRDFHSLGAVINEREISMLMDRNMVYSSSTNSYSEGTNGSLVVGCAHLRLSGSYDDYASAYAVASGYEDGFVRYENGRFVVLVGQYLSADAAIDARSRRGIDATADTGTSHTVTVVKSRTNRILFEYDCGTESSLAVRPLAPEGVKAQTWFKQSKYYGSFSYLRNTGGYLTVVNYIDVEDYVKGVIPYEMSPVWPREALKAQAIAARTYVMANITKHRASGFDVCNTTDCQAYHGIEREGYANKANENTDAAVDETFSQYLTYKGALCQTNYYSSNGGASENSENVWANKLDYLRGVKDPYEKNIAGTVSGYYWTKTFTPASLGQRLREKGFSSSDVVRIDMTFTEMGNVLSITFTDKNGKKNTVSKEKVRTVPGVRSPRYTVNGLGPAEDAGTVYVNGGIPLENGLDGVYAVGAGGIGQLPDGDVYAITGTGTVGKVDTSAVTVKGGVGVNSSGKFVFSGSGYGHNVGMSQWGAYSMALYYGMDSHDILTFYFSGTEVVTSPRQEQTYYPGGDQPIQPPVAPEPDTPEPQEPPVESGGEEPGPEGPGPEEPPGDEEEPPGDGEQPPGDGEIVPAE